MLKFDAVIGNPPFNASREAGQGSTSTLWDKFVTQSFDVVKQGGYVALVHPSPWRKPEHKLWPLLTSKKMEYLRMISMAETIRTFGAGTKVDCYVVRNETPTTSHKTQIVQEDGQKLRLDLRPLPFLPGRDIKTILSLLVKNNESACDVLYDTAYHGITTKAQPENDFVNKVVQNISRKGPTFRWANHRNGHYGVRKVILNEAGHLYPLNDWAGELAMSQGAFGLIVNTEKEAREMTLALGSAEFDNQVIQATKWGLLRTDYKMFKHFRKDFWRQYLPK